MSVEVRPAVDGDIDAVCDLLYSHMSSKVGREGWRRILDYPWRPADADRGRVVVDGDCVVGFLGHVYADRVINGRVERFCNLCAWYLLRDYRSCGLGRDLLHDSVADPNVTYTNLTATAAAALAMHNAGLRVLDDRRYVLRRRFGGADRPLPELIEGPDALEALLGGEERRILDDHRRFNLRHLAFRADGRSCYLVLQVKRKGPDIAYHEVMYASDPPLLAAHAQAVADRLLPSDDALLAVDCRFAPGMPTSIETELIPQPRLYKSRRLRPGQLDHLYTEIVLLDLKLP